MKRWIGLCLLFSLTAALLCGCGGVPVTEREPEHLLAAGRDWAEPNAVDDCYTAEYDDDTDVEGWIRDELLPAYVKRWVENGNILQTELKGYRGWDQSCWYGWICFTGRPKTELGWQETEYEGKRCYCRSLFLRSRRDTEGLHHLRAEKSMAMEPVELNCNMVTVDGANLFEIKRLENLESAELYVPSLGQSFVITDPAALRDLERCFTAETNLRGEPGFHMGGLPADPCEQEKLCPLYLHFADGTEKLMLAAGDGADFCVAWGAPDDRFGPVSVFERFGVPREAAGYRETENGGTVVEVNYAGLDGGQNLHYTRTARSTYDAQGRIIRYEEKMLREDWDGDDLLDRQIFYRSDGKMESYTQKSHDHDGNAWTTLVSFDYNEKGWLTRMSNTLVEGGLYFGNSTGGYYYDYSYDEEGRLLSAEYHYADGSEGRPSGNAYYWYDEDGQVHSYQVDEEGNLTGGLEGEGTDRPVRRK